MNAKIRLLTYLRDCKVSEGIHVDEFFSVYTGGPPPGLGIDRAQWDRSFPTKKKGSKPGTPKHVFATRDKTERLC